MLDYFRQVSVFESALALFLILGASLAFTLVHVWQEWKGEEVPLWRVFGAVVGTFLPNWLGFLSFTIGLCALQWLIGAMAIAGWPMFTGHPWWSIWALGALVGARIADSVVSHWLLYGLRYRPNPGLSSTVLYAIEAIFHPRGISQGLCARSARLVEGFRVRRRIFHRGAPRPLAVALAGSTLAARRVGEG
jgi:hypothetical protein